MDRCLINYFQELFTSAHLQNFDAATNSIESIISANMNAQLSVDFMEWEFQTTLKKMVPLKALGPDGMPPLFYQHFWNLTSEDVTKSVLKFLNSTSLPKHLNHTFLTLIPKKKNAEYASEFRPISLCNVLYKFFFESLGK